MRRTMLGSLVVMTLVLVLSAPAVGAQQWTTEDPILEAIWERAMDDSPLETLAQSLLDSIGPRLTASPQMESAQEWAIERLRGWGIEADLEQYGTWEGWDRGVSHIDLISPRVRSLEGQILAWSPGTGGRPVEGGVTALPTIRRPADWEAFLATVQGQWVMMSFPQPTCRPDDQYREFAMNGSFERMDAERETAEQAWERSLANTGSQDTRGRELFRALESAGALGIVTSNWTGEIGSNRVFNSYTREVPTFELSCEDYGLLYRLSRNGQDPVVRLTAESENLGEVPVYNVIGTIPGTELADEYVMLSAHYDSWEGGSGATDNGTGSILMLEAMRILADVLPNPKRTIMIGLWSGEEQGLNGSRAFTEDNPEVVEGLQALFNQDNGTGRIVSMSASGLTEAGSSLARWLSKIPSDVTRHIDLSFPGSPSSGGSDHAAFQCWGAPGFSLGALNWDYFSHTWHTQRDTYDKLVFDDLRNNAMLIASLAYLASEDDQRVARERRDVITSRGGRTVDWPSCEPADRSSGESPRMDS